MHFRIVIATLLLAAPLAYSQTGTPSDRTAPSSQLRSYTKPPAAQTRIKTSVDEFVLWIDETKWKQETSDFPGLLTFSHVNGEAQVFVNSSRIGTPTTVLRDSILRLEKDEDPNAHIIFEEKRTVNGRQVLATEISTTEEGVPYRSLGYYHGGSSGSIAVVGCTAETLFSKNTGDVTEFLNGLELSDQELPSSANREDLSNPGLLFVNSKVTIKYDPIKWKQIRSNEVATFIFLHSSGGDVKVKSKRWSERFDFLPDIVLSTLHSKAPNARIMVKERRVVNGAEVWFLKIDAEPYIMPMVLCGYFYSDKNGTIQVWTLTQKSLFGEFEKDFMAFLNGLWISE